ncbi:MAG TPA: flavin reductase [Dyella sp.]|uniref:flavin reductase n=1 Tax=Dyella sp. TaxID=1869338 RepID=UPI002BDEBF3F|nr:flavin reductase [Dyella sp.]HTV85278.1 flavin reductase [Dyella sp.]
MWRDWIRPLVSPLPQWSPVAIAPPAQMVTAILRGEGIATDVTADHTIAALKPLVIASSVDAGAHPILEYRDSANGALLGVLHLKRAASIATERAALMFYQVDAGEHRCLRWPRRPWNEWLQNRRMLKQQQPHHLAMVPAAVQQLMIAYLCPRPVVLVSVGAPGHQNMFPMDLIGPLERSGYFSLALRSTNVSQAVMRDVRRVALSSIPATMKKAAYALSEQHKKPLADWQSLPFHVRPSWEFGIPAVADALRIRELSIVHSEQIGSHTFFLGRIVSDEHLAQGRQLHHTAGFHQAYRRRLRTPFTEV